MRGEKITRTDLKCEHGPVGECYASSRGCVLCGHARSVAQGRQKHRARDPAKQKTYYRKWYKKHGHHYNVAWAAKRKNNPEVLARAQAYQGKLRLSAEIRALHDIGVAGRALLAQRRVTLAYRCAARLRKSCAVRTPTTLDWDTDWLRRKLEILVKRGHISLETGRPDSASIDQAIAGLGYHRANIQIVPLWYNFAKHQWDPADVREAIRKWCIAEKV